MSNERYQMVKEFHQAFGLGTAEKPTPIDKETALNRATWTGEEIIEFIYATVNGDVDEFHQLAGEFIDRLHILRNKMAKNAAVIDDVLTAQADALTDIDYFNQGTFTLMGVEPFNLFKIVQEANMGKLWEDGKPRFRENDGKIMKPPNWEKDYAPEPRLKQEIERQKG
ncbi:HAD family hydrolase [Bacillus sp. PAMC26568]|nr:HAD family hydrolase [Bacillus sp. PAMC26568]